MNNDIKIFENKEFGKIRSVEANGEVYFVGKDIAEVLGYSKSDKAINQHVDEDDKLMYQIGTSGQNRKMIVINESGLYSLILSSKLPNAKKFKKWVTSEVLPTIRKHGMYATDKLLNNPDFAIQVFMELKKEKDEKQQLLVENAQNQQLIGELKPKADYLDQILKSKDTLTVTQIGADYGLSAIALNRILNEEGIQRNVNDQWILYKKYMNQGLTKSKTVEFFRKDGTLDYKLITRWTQKGRVLIHKILEQRGIKANMDKQLI